MSHPTDAIRNWLKAFEGHVRRHEFDAATALFEPDCYCFGSVTEAMASISELVEKQWKRIWSNIDDFTVRFDDGDCQVSASGDLATVACPWTSTGYHDDGTAFPRNGRLTIMLRRPGGAGPWRARHSHFSLTPGTPPATRKDETGR